MGNRKKIGLNQRRVSRKLLAKHHYLRCHNLTFCFGTAKIENNNLVHVGPHSEDCLPDERSALVGAFKEAIKESLAAHWWKLRDLFDRTSLLYPEAAELVTFRSMKSFMMRCRRTSHPARPSDIAEFGEQLNDQQNRRLLEYAGGRFTTKLLVDDGGNKHVLIYDEQFIRVEVMRDLDLSKLFIDATFRSTPNLDDAYQLMTIIGIKYNHGIPFVWVVMSRKLELSYTCIFQYIRDNLIPEAPIDVIMSDFEAAIRNASNQVFPQAHCAGCNTHYDRAVLQKLKSLRLQNFIRDNEDAKLLTKKLLALAYLPADMIHHQYETIKNGLPAYLKRRFNEFFTYYERYWLRTVSPSGYSVFGLSRRTNNILESYNAKLGKRLEASPSPWEFIDKLLQLQEHARCDVGRLARNPGGITRHPRYQTIYKNDVLLKETDPDHDRSLFRGVLPGDFMRDLAPQQPEHRENAADNPERPRTPERQLVAADLIAAPVLGRPAMPEIFDEPEPFSDHDDMPDVPDRAPTPEIQRQADELDDPMPERPHTPAAGELQNEEDDYFHVLEAPPTPEAVVRVEEAVAPERPLPPGQAARGEAVAGAVVYSELTIKPYITVGSRNSRRRKRQRQRRRNVIANPEDAADAVPREHRRRLGTNEEGPNRTCVVCLINPITHAFLPCGHRSCCDGCSTRIYCDGELRTCPTCRANLERSPIRVFI